MVYWLSLDVVEQRAEEEGRETASRAEELDEGEGEMRERGRTNQAEREEQSKKIRRSETGGYGPQRRLVYGSADAHHLLKKTCCSKCVHFACAPGVHRPVGTTKSPTVSHSTLLRFSPDTAQVTALSFFDKRWSRGNLVSQRRLTCHREYSGFINFVSTHLLRDEDSRVACMIV